MPRPPDTSWGFDAVIDFVSDGSIASLPEPLSSPKSTRSAPGAGGINETETASMALGDFTSLFEQLGISADKPVQPITLPEPAIAFPVATDHQESQEDTVPSLVDDVGESGDADDSLEEEELAEKPADPFAGMNKKQRKRARRKARATEKVQLHLLDIAGLNQETPLGPIHAKIPVWSQHPSVAGEPPSPITPIANVDVLQPEDLKGAIIKSADGAPSLLPAIPLTTRQQSISTPQPGPVNTLNAALTAQYATSKGTVPYHQLTSAFVTPKQKPVQNKRKLHLQCTTSSDGAPVEPAQSFVPLFQPSVIRNANPPPPILHVKQPPIPKVVQQPALRPREDRNFDFFTKLMSHFAEDKKWLVSPMRLTSDQLSPQGLHVFVDASNILFGFRDVLKKMPGSTVKCGMSFDCLALLMERRRPVAKRVYAGSARESETANPAEKFAGLAGDIGYQMHIYEQVYKTREDSKSKKFFKNVEKFGWAKAMQMRDESGSDSETGLSPTTPKAPKWVEQGVDESIHLQMCQSIIDAEVPSTMVLATGDGAVAEYSDGFLANVERALKKGWKVELVSWRQAINSGYRNKKFKAKWGDAFRIIELDAYLSDMIDQD